MIAGELLGPGSCPVLIGDLILTNPTIGIAGTVVGVGEASCTVETSAGAIANVASGDIVAHLDRFTGQSKKLRVVDMIGELPTDAEGWGKALLRCSSYERMPVLVHVAGYLDGADWLRLLADHWTDCDNVGEHVNDLMSFTAFGDLADDPGSLRDFIMDDEERAAFASLPDDLTVYRGCYSANKWGLSWSTDRGTAERFPTLHRYRQDGQPLLVTARVAKADILAVKNGRGEAEIVCHRPKHVSTRFIRGVPRPDALSQLSKGALASLGK